MTRTRPNKATHLTATASGDSQVQVSRAAAPWRALALDSHIVHGSIYESDYDQMTVNVICPRFKEPLSVQTIVVDANGMDLLPTSAYLHIIVEGAREHGLPTAYCEWLANLKTLDAGTTNQTR